MGPRTHDHRPAEVHCPVFRSFTLIGRRDAIECYGYLYRGQSITHDFTREKIPYFCMNDSENANDLKPETRIDYVGEN